MRILKAASLAAALAIGFAQAGFAADMLVKALVYKAPMVALVYNWTGFYLGGTSAARGATQTQSTPLAGFYRASGTTIGIDGAGVLGGFSLASTGRPAIGSSASRVICRGRASIPRVIHSQAPPLRRSTTKPIGLRLLPDVSGMRGTTCCYTARAVVHGFTTNMTSATDRSVRLHGQRHAKRVDCWRRSRIRLYAKLDGIYRVRPH